MPRMGEEPLLGSRVGSLQRAPSADISPHGIPWTSTADAARLAPSTIVPPSPKWALCVVFLALLADFALLTVVVPIFPLLADGLCATWSSGPACQIQVGMLFGAKPLTQLIMSFVVGQLVDSGQFWMFPLGLVVELGTCAVFCLADTFALVLACRALQGCASAGIITTGDCTLHL
jgi:MFS family permease